EFCNAPIAVMTRMIENTPMVMPTIVRAARNLFAPNELNAIFRISLNCMIRIEVMECWCQHYSLLQHSITPSFIPQRGDRVESRCRPCRREPGAQSCHDRH